MKQSLGDDPRLQVVYSGIPLVPWDSPSQGLRKQLGIAEDRILVGNTSAIADHKDYFTFVDTAKLVIKKHSEVLFLIIGDGPMREEITYNIEKNKRQFLHRNK